MKIILFFMAPILLIVIAIGCSKEHNAPTFAKYAVTSKPTDVVATYDPATQSVNVTWDMSDITGVIDYYVSISDSSDFDFGNVLVRITNSLDRSYSFNVVKYVQAETGSIVLYFTVSAVYKNENLDYFVGPRADNPDSTLVIIE